MPGKLRRSRRGVLEKRWQSLEERGSAGTWLEHPVLTRSQTCDPSFCKGTEQDVAAAGRQGPLSPSESFGEPGPSRGDSSPSAVVLAGRSPRGECRGTAWPGCVAEVVMEQGAALPQASRHTGPKPQPPLQLSKHGTSYRKAFGELAEQEPLLACFSCAWQREVPYHGHLYISSRHICFHSTLLLKDIKAVVPVASIAALKKTNTALLVPNALSIRTAEGQKFLFVSLRRREATYQLLKSICKRAQDNGQSPLASPSTKEIPRKPLTLSQLDLEQSTPEPNSLQEPPDGLTPRQEGEEDEEVAALALSSGGPHATLWPWTTMQLSALDTIVLIYLLLMVALLLSSGYIGLRIVELEQQLASVGAWPHLNLSHQYKKT